MNLEISKCCLFLLCLAACQTVSRPETVAPPVAQDIKLNIGLRSAVYGENRALEAGYNKVTQSYVFRNIASAFPDNGKKMMVKAKALKSSEVKANPESSPWQNRFVRSNQNSIKNIARFGNVNKASYQVSISEETARQMLERKKDPILAPSYYQAQIDTRDDLFEPNNDLSTATSLAGAEGRWLALAGDTSHVLTEGIQWNRDFYKIKVSPLFRNLIVDLRYQHYMGNVDLHIYNESGTEIIRSDRSGDDEYINITLDRGGVYYLLVDGQNQGNRYDFKFSTEFTGANDDMMEENDTLAKAYDLTSIENQWFSETIGEGVAGDDDYYRIKVLPGKTRLKIDLRYEQVYGDIDMSLMNSQGQVIATSSSIGNDEFIDFDVLTAGNYFLRIYPFTQSKLAPMYDLKWESGPSERTKTRISKKADSATVSQ